MPPLLFFKNSSAMKYPVLFLALVFFAIFSAGAQGKQSAASVTNATAKAYAGHWQKGVFSLSSFEEHNGKYVGPANETSVSYVIDANGVAKEYFISNTNTYNCRTQVLGFRTGKIIIHEKDQSFEFRPVSGYYTILSCMSKTAAKKPYGAGDLYPAYVVKGHLKKESSGATVLVTYTNGSASALELKKVN